MELIAFILFIVAAILFVADAVVADSPRRYPLTLLAHALVAVGLALLTAELTNLFEGSDAVNTD